MGSEDFYPEERPVRRVEVDGFWIDLHPVTVANFREFVSATGYRTVAERRRMRRTFRAWILRSSCRGRSSSTWRPGVRVVAHSHPAGECVPPNPYAPVLLPPGDVQRQRTTCLPGTVPMLVIGYEKSSLETCNATLTG